MPSEVTMVAVQDSVIRAKHADGAEVTYGTPLWKHCMQAAHLSTRRTAVNRMSVHYTCNVLATLRWCAMHDVQDNNFLISACRALSSLRLADYHSRISHTASMLAVASACGNDAERKMQRTDETHSDRTQVPPPL